MDKLVLNLPALWADHHVLIVRDTLFGLSGVEDVYASSAWKQVMVTYDSSRVEPATIERALAEAGYPVGAGEPPILAQASAVKRDPQWSVLGSRLTETQRVDQEMSGEFRRY
ncbi:MAG: heavy-metal-associated domain-containing protein [Chloroflexi bacterium]|nr:heavy-metal-associated domain-containing protein [Chloroflexota bacterium]